MSKCITCARREVFLRQRESDFRLAARKAARDPSPRRLAVVELAKGKRDDARQSLDRPCPDCGAA